MKSRIHTSISCLQGKIPKYFEKTVSDLKNLSGLIPDLPVKEAEMEGKATGMRGEFLSPTSYAKDTLPVALQLVSLLVV